MSLADTPLATRLKTIIAQMESSKSATLHAPLSLGQPPRLIAVSKGQPVEAVEAAIALGVTDFGENRVQEAEGKYEGLKARHPQIRLHLIGPLQTNKVKEAVALFDMIHTVDRAKLADSLKAEMDKQDRALPCLIQVNVGEEPQKAGVAPQELDGLLAHCTAAGLPICGLMGVPPVGVPPAPYFAWLYKNARAHDLSELSMGMSGDFETAIRFGATMIRVGTALFGERA